MANGLLPGSRALSPGVTQGRSALKDRAPPYGDTMPMIFPATTAFYAALLALLYLGLSGWVMASRVSGNVLFGDGGDEAMLKRVRSHANFAEYVPIALIVIALLEAGGAVQGLVRGLLIALLAGRILHPVGMFAAPNSPRQFACRGGGILLTMAALAVAAIALLLRVN
jgi:uncharacterized membrane protein YecN with MAPEG domain